MASLEQTQTAARIYVFGSNLAGRHGRGTARVAVLQHGARFGVGFGRTGNAYAIPTKDALLRPLPLPVIASAVRRFIDYAKRHPELTFDVVKVGCGLAGFREEQIAPMFYGAPLNVQLPPNWEALAAQGAPDA